MSAIVTSRSTNRQRQLRLRFNVQRTDERRCPSLVLYMCQGLVIAARYSDNMNSRNRFHPISPKPQLCSCIFDEADSQFQRKSEPISKVTQQQTSRPYGANSCRRTQLPSSWPIMRSSLSTRNENSHSLFSSFSSARTQCCSDSEGTGGGGCAISHAMMGICYGGRFGFIVHPARHSLPECLAQGPRI
jgi:hypothetical protein